MKPSHTPSQKILGGLFAALLGLSPISAAHAQYTSQLLSFPGSNFTQADGISGNDIVGTYGNSDGSGGSYLYNGSSYTIINSPLYTNYGFTVDGIDGNNLIGFSYNGTANVPVLDQNGSWSTLTNPFFTNSSGPFNDNNVNLEKLSISGNYIAGTSTNWNTDVATGFLYNFATNTLTTLPEPANTTFGVNVFGIGGNTVVGGYAPSPSGQVPFAYNIGTSTYTTLTGFANPQNGYIAQGVNGNTIVGSNFSTSGASPFVYNISTGTYTTISGQATLVGVNTKGQVIGQVTGSSSASVLLTPTSAATSSSVTPTTTTTNFTQPTPYSTVTPATAQGGFQTTASLIGGTASASTSVTLAFTGGNFSSIASDAMSVTGTGSNIIALQLTFDLTAAQALGGTSNMKLLWLDPTTHEWVNAVNGNVGGTPTNMGDGAYNPATDFHLGDYGYDDQNGQEYAWAVIDHNSTFGVGNSLDAPQDAPEPSTWALLLGGLGLLAFCRARRAATC